jgi:NAD(P)H dehydrogenase (quinone)
MRALVVYCHPRTESFTAAVRDVVIGRLEAAGIETRLLDLYASGFDPCLSGEDHAGYQDAPQNRAKVAAHCDDIEWCDTLLFVYPTWWYGLPAMLKGWLDRVLLPEVAFRMPDEPGGAIRPGLTHIVRLGVFTTCGASRWLTFWVGAPGKRTLLRGLRILCGPRCRTAFTAHYLMDSSTPDSRSAHLERVAHTVDRLMGSGSSQDKEVSA